MALIATTFIRRSTVAWNHEVIETQMP